MTCVSILRKVLREVVYNLVHKCWFTPSANLLHRVVQVLRSDTRPDACILRAVMVAIPQVDRAAPPSLR